MGAEDDSTAGTAATIDVARGVEEDEEASAVEVGRGRVCEAIPLFPADDGAAEADEATAEAAEETLGATEDASTEAVEEIDAATDVGRELELAE